MMYKDVSTLSFDSYKALLSTSSDLKDAYDCARRYQNSLNVFVDHRRHVIETGREKCEQLNVYKRNGSIISATGGAIGTVGGALTIAAFSFLPVLVISAPIIGVVGGVTFIGSKYITDMNREKTINKFKEDVKEDKRLLEELMRSDKELEDLIDRIIKKEGLKHDLQHETDVATIPMIAANAVITAGQIATTAMTILRATELRASLRLSFQSIAAIGVAFGIVCTIKCILDSLQSSKLGEEIGKVYDLMEEGLTAITEERPVQGNDDN